MTRCKPNGEWQTGYGRNGKTWIGQVFRDDPEEGRRQLVRILRRHGGVVKSVALDLGVTRRWIFYLLWRENLWPTLDEIRAERKRERERASKGPLVRAIEHGARLLAEIDGPRHDSERDVPPPSLEPDRRTRPAGGVPPHRRGVRGGR